MKPLGRKGYGSIPHLPGSRLGPGDHHCHDGQEIICTKKLRDRHDRVIVTEKLDGSNVSVAKLDDGSVVAINRAGYLCQTSPHEQHQLFADWVRKNLIRFEHLPVGHRFVGEWLALAHGTRYALTHDPFVVFDLMTEDRRLGWDSTTKLASICELPYAAVISDGPAIGVESVMNEIGSGSHGAIDPVEGAVWRVERRGEFDFMAKFVRHDKIDGKFFEQVSGEPPIWNWRP